jgi:hypothetical protein
MSIVKSESQTGRCTGRAPPPAALSLRMHGQLGKLKYFMARDERWCLIWIKQHKLFQRLGTAPQNSVRGCNVVNGRWRLRALGTSLALGIPDLDARRRCACRYGLQQGFWFCWSKPSSARPDRRLDLLPGEPSRHRDRALDGPALSESERSRKPRQLRSNADFAMSNSASVGRS